MKSKIARYTICFVLLFALCRLFPYTGDDWGWGSSIGVLRLDRWFSEYNGRYFSNILAMLLTRSNLLKALVMASVYTGILFCIEKLTRRKWAFFLSAALLVLLPRLIFRQAVVWTSGFVNYSLPALFVLILFVITDWIFDSDPGAQKLRQKPLAAAFMLIYGFLCALIVENLSVYLIFLGLFLLIFVYCRFRKLLIQHAALLIGALAGTAWMFSNTAYRAIAGNTDFYRSFAGGGVIPRAVDNFLGCMYSDMLMGNVWLLLGLSAACFLAFPRLKAACSKSGSRLAAALLGIMLFYTLGAFVSAALTLCGLEKSAALIAAEGVATLVFAAAVIVFAALAAAAAKEPARICFVMGSIVFIAAPLLIVSPIGSRCFFITYVLFCLLICYLLRLSPCRIDSLLSKKAFGAACSLLCAGALCFYGLLFYDIHTADAARLAHIRADFAAGKTQSEILHLPHESYIWCPTPAGGDNWERYYKLFYGLPEEYSITPCWEYSD